MSLRQKDVSPSRVAIYIRWSTDDQSEGTTLEVQLENCTQYVKSQGWDVSEDLIFIDDGYSGASLDRPALTRLREAVRSGAVDCVVVFKLDRLSRNVVDTVSLVLREWDGRCCIKSAREPIDTFTPTGRMFFYTLSSFGEWERATIRERTMSGKIRRAQEGRNPGMRPPYGYTCDEVGRFVVVPHEAEVVKRIFWACVSGHSTWRIADTLNTIGLTNRDGRPWTSSLVSYILCNKIYTGTLIWGIQSVDSKGISGKRRVNNEKPHALKEGGAPAIVTPEEWRRAAAVRAKRPRPGSGSGRGVSSPHLLTGLLRCSHCKSTFSATSTTVNGHRYVYYRCGGVSARPQRCWCKTIHADLLDKLVTRALLVRYASEVSRRSYADSIMRQVRAEIEEARAALENLRTTLAGLADSEKYARSLLLKRKITPDEFRKMQGDLEAERAQLAAQREQLQTQIAAHQAALQKGADLEAAMESLDKWDDLTAIERKEVLRKFLDGVKAYQPAKGNTLDLLLRWRDLDEAPPEETTLEVPSLADNWATRKARKALIARSGA